MECGSHSKIKIPTIVFSAPPPNWEAANSSLARVKDLSGINHPMVDSPQDILITSLPCCGLKLNVKIAHHFTARCPCFLCVPFIRMFGFGVVGDVVGCASRPAQLGLAANLQLHTQHCGYTLHVLMRHITCRCICTRTHICARVCNEQRIL